jgi:uncharacterized protein YhbP (UPF0306 family)
MSENNDLESIRHFMKKNHLLTICARDEEDMWCANCFYVADVESMSLYFMTDSKTRHGGLMVKNNTVVGTIAPQPRTVAVVKGIQYQGEAILLQDEADKAARQLYCKRFPVARVMNSPIWQLRLDDIKMTDNTLGFGKKLQWSRA